MNEWNKRINIDIKFLLHLIFADNIVLLPHHSKKKAKLWDYKMQVHQNLLSKIISYTGGNDVEIT